MKYCINWKFLQKKKILRDREDHMCDSQMRSTRGLKLFLKEHVTQKKKESALPLQE